MKKYYYAYALVAVLSVSCKTGDPAFEYIPLDEYKYEEANIKEGAKIEILSFSGVPSCTPEATYYYQFIGINKENNDTVRILTPCAKLPDSGNPGEGSFSPWDETKSIIDRALKEHGQNGFESENKIVVFNRLNAELEKRNFKTAIGTLGF